MKQQRKTYFRTFYISLVILSCILFGWIGISSAYENTVKTGYGEYKKAVEFTDGKLRILDFVVYEK